MSDVTTTRDAAVMRATANLVIETDEQEIALYRIQVRRMMQEARGDKLARVFRNRGPQHARAVVDTMLDSAMSSVEVFAHELSSDVYDPEQIKSVLDRRPEISFTVVLEDSGALYNKSSALSALLEQVRAHRVKVFQAHDCPQNKNVCIVDGQHIRLEKDQQTRQAIVAFYADEELRADASKFFSDLLAGATPVTTEKSV